MRVIERTIGLAINGDRVPKRRRWGFREELAAMPYPDTLSGLLSGFPLSPLREGLVAKGSEGAELSERNHINSVVQITCAEHV